MNKEYMLKRIESWINSHDGYSLYVDGTSGVYVLCDDFEYSDNLSHDRFFGSLTQLYNYLFV